MSANNSILDQILSEYDRPEKMQIRNVESVNKLIRQIVQGGAPNLQVITDFDFTLSKTHVSGQKCYPAAGIIRQSSLMSDEFRARAHERYERLLPIELDTNLTIEQKIPSVIDSFQEGFADLVRTKLTRRNLGQIIHRDENFQLRDNAEMTLRILHDQNVPVLVFSGGFGDVIQGVLHKHEIYYTNIHVIANFMEFHDDGEHGELIGFKEPLIHTFNKNETVIPKDSQYFQNLAHRNNVILLGDSIGDATMAKGAHNPSALLKIGFLNEKPEELLDSFLDTFDIVLLDDQTMDFINLVLKRICS